MASRCLGNQQLACITAATGSDVSSGQRHRVVVVGGGFGGLFAARRLAHIELASYACLGRAEHQFAVGRPETGPPLRCGSEGSALLGATFTCVFGEVGVAAICEDADATGPTRSPPMIRTN